MTATLKVVDEHFGTSAPIRRVAIALRQIDDRDEMVRLRPDSEVVFASLMFLKGG